MFQQAQSRILTVLAIVAYGVLAINVNAQQPTDTKYSQHSTTDVELGTQLKSLQSKVAELEAALAKQHQANFVTAPAMEGATMKPMKKMQGMGMEKDMGGMATDSGSESNGMGMGMMGGGMGMMSGMKKDGIGGMMGMGMGMGMMGRNPAMKSNSMSGMSMPSALPGFPGASHLYHIGETGFFLDHSDHIALTDQQQKQLNEIKENALLATATSERKIDEAEQELWTLTAEGQPDITKIEAKAKEIAQLQVENRIAFIRSVGKAAEVLTEEQRQTLVGMEMPVHAPK